LLTIAKTKVTRHEDLEVRRAARDTEQEAVAGRGNGKGGCEHKTMIQAEDRIMSRSAGPSARKDTIAR
jgi:hypothetical protein